jgi:hypothetical protein
MNNKLNELLVFSLATTWVPMELYRQVIAVGTVAVTSPPGEVTVQLRKAINANGDSPANLGTAATGDSQAIAQAFAVDLGETEGGVPYTHVSATITPPGSPPVDLEGVVIRGEGRFSE